MIDCPVEMVDYESSLVAADWYEEQGEQLTAGQIRMLSVPQHYIPSMRVRQQYKKGSKRVSRTHTSGGHKFRISWCNNSHNGSRSGTSCRSKAYSTSATKSGVKIGFI